MSTVEDFKNAPVGATATHGDGGRAMKMDYVERRWIVPNGFCLDDEEMERRDYTLDPLEPAPATVREAVELVWELAHPVKEGQVIPEGTWLVDRRDNKITVEKNTFFNIAVDEWGEENIRTLEPLHEQEPEWLDAPAVLATCGCRGMELWQPHNEKDGTWECAHCGFDCHWSELRDVTPLYPKGQDA